MSFRSIRVIAAALLAAVFAGLAATPLAAADEPDLIFRRSTVFKLLSPDDKLATYGVDDPPSRAWRVISRSRRRAAIPAG